MSQETTRMREGNTRLDTWVDHHMADYLEDGHRRLSNVHIDEDGLLGKNDLTPKGSQKARPRRFPMKKPPNIQLSVLATVIPLILLCCKAQPLRWEGSAKKINGLIIVTNPDHPIYGDNTISIERELAIGGESKEDELAFSAILSFDIDRDDNIYVLDAKSASATVIDRRGHFLRTIGSYGQGPGELQRPQFIQVCRDSPELIIWDPVVSRFLYFTLEGKYIRQLSAAKQGRPLNPIKWDNKGNLVSFMIPPPIEGGVALAKYDRWLDLIMTIAEEDKDDAFLRREHMVIKPTLSCAVSNDDTVIWGNAKKYEIHTVNAEGATTATISRACKAKRLSRSLIKQLEERYSRSSSARFGSKPIFPKYLPFYRNISVDEVGRIYILTYESAGRRDGYYYDVFDSAGRYVTRFIMKSGTRGMIWRNTKLYTIETDDEGYNMIVRYKVTWNIDISMK